MKLSTTRRRILIALTADGWAIRRNPMSTALAAGRLPALSDGIPAACSSRFAPTGSHPLSAGARAAVPLETR